MFYWWSWIQTARSQYLAMRWENRWKGKLWIKTMPGPVRIAVTRLSPCKLTNTIKKTTFLESRNKIIDVVLGQLWVSVKMRHQTGWTQQMRPYLLCIKPHKISFSKIMQLQKGWVNLISKVPEPPNFSPLEAATYT